MRFYQDDVDPSRLRIQLQMLSTSLGSLEQATLPDIVEYFRSLSPAHRSCMSEVCTLLKLVLVIPATNAVSERSASALRRVKSYLRSTMSQSRLNNLMVLHVHKQRTDSLNLKACVNEFICANDHRSQNIEKF